MSFFDDDTAKTAGKLISGAASGLFGITKTVVTGVGGLAVDAASSVKETIVEDKKLYDDAVKQNEQNKRRMKESVDHYEQKFMLLQEDAKRLDELKTEIARDFKRIDKGFQYSHQSADISHKEVENVDKNIDTDGLLKGGAAAGTIAAGTATALTMAFGTAGTGAAISGLTGTYAISATLASLGGGTIVSGGLGVAGGAAVLGGLFAVPAVAVGGVLAHNKVQKFAKDVQEATTKVQQAIETNRQAEKKIETIRKQLRTIYDVGTGISFFLRNLGYRAENAPAKVRPQMMVIKDAARDKLVRAFGDINLFQSNSTDLDNSIGETLREIEHDCQALQDFTTARGYTKVCSSKDSTAVYQSIYRSAKRYVYIAYPWYNTYCVRQDLPLIKDAIQRGVRFTFFYGIGEMNDAGGRKTMSAIRLLKQSLPLSVRFKRIDSHTKVILTEGQILYGSQNMMTYRYPGKYNDKRSEASVFSKEPNIIADYKEMLDEEKSV